MDSPKTGWPREPRRLQNVVTAGRNKRSADEYHVRERVKASQLANRVEHQHIRVFIERRRKINPAAADDGPAALRCDLRCRVEAVRLARCEHQQGVPPLALDNIIRGHYRFFLFGHNASRNQDRPALLRLNLTREPGAEFSDRRRVAVIFQVAAYFHAIFRRAHLAQARGILGRLRQENVGVLHHALEKRLNEKSPLFIARE